MARYIDADNFRKTMIKRFGCIPCLTDYSEASRADIPIDDALNLAPTADVVPKSEITEIFAEIEKILKSSPTEIMGQAYYYKCIVDEDFAELKKKYTEDQT